MIPVAMTGFPTQIYQAAHCCSNQLSDEKSVLSYNCWMTDDAVEFSSDMTGGRTEDNSSCVLLFMWTKLRNTPFFENGAFFFNLTWFSHQMTLFNITSPQRIYLFSCSYRQTGVDYPAAIQAQLSNKYYLKWRIDPSFWVPHSVHYAYKHSLVLYITTKLEVSIPRRQAKREDYVDW